MKKKTVANLIMVAVILMIAAAGILGTGYIQGWFDTADGTQAVLQNTRGVIDLMREGVSYPAQNNTVLRTGDKLTCQHGATAMIRIGNALIAMGEKAALTVTDPSAEGFSAEVHTGEVFAHCDTSTAFAFDGKKIVFQQATILLSVRSGAQSICVLRGSVEDAGAGQILEFIGDEKNVGQLALNSLNDFAITQIRSLNDISLYFTAEDLDRLAAERQQAVQELINDQAQADTPSTVPAAPTEIIDPIPSETSKQNTEEPTPPNTTIPSEATTPSETIIPSETAAPSETYAPPVSGCCTIAIYCETILDNMGDLEPGKAEFVPSDGVILYPVTVDFYDGETVFDVLKRVCDAADIQLEYSWTPLYDSYYVEGINNLYEFDCGFESGWMYKVNGWFPNYGCSSYTLKDSDVIVWAYTCKGLGTDVGAPRME